MQEQACGALRNLSIMPANKQRLAQLDGVPALIQLLSSPHEEVQAQACMVLQNLSKSSDCRHVIVQQGGIPPLIALLWSFNEHVQEHSAGIVANLSVNPDNARKIVEEGGMPLLIGLLRSPCPGVQEQAAVAIRNLSVEPENEVSFRCACHAVAYVKSAIIGAHYGGGRHPPTAGSSSVQQRGFPAAGHRHSAQFERSRGEQDQDRAGRRNCAPGGAFEITGQTHSAAQRWHSAESEVPSAARPAFCMRLILFHCSVHAENCQRIVQAQGLLPLIALLRSPDPAIQEEALFTLRNVSSQPSGRIDLVREGGLNALIATLRSPTPSLQEQAAATIRNLSADDAIKVKLVAEGALIPLVQLLESINLPVQEHAVSTLANITMDARNDEAILQAGALPSLMLLLKSPNLATVEHAAICIRNLSTTSEVKEKIVSRGGLPLVIALLKSPTVSTREHCAVVLRNLSVLPENHTRLVDEGAVPLLIDLLDGEDLACKAEAVVALQNVSMKAGNEVIIVKDGGIPALVPLLLLPMPEVQEAACATLVNVSLVFNPMPHRGASYLSVQVSAMLDHDARIVKAGALVPLCKMLLSSLVTTQEYTSGLLRNLVAYNAGATSLALHYCCISFLNCSFADVKLRAYEAGILPPLIQLLTTRERMVLQNSIATIRNLSFHPEVKAALMEAGAMYGSPLTPHTPPTLFSQVFALISRLPRGCL